MMVISAKTLFTLFYVICSLGLIIGVVLFIKSIRAKNNKSISRYICLYGSPVIILLSAFTLYMLLTIQVVY